jgi:tRNA-dihydrouridine synthase
MMARTGCDGVVVGRGCLGRPWLFRDLTAAMSGDGTAEPARPSLGEVAATMARHAALLVECFGSEPHAIADFRKHIGWYLKGFAVGGDTRRALATAESLAGLRARLDDLDPAQPWPREAEGPRGKSNARERVHLPEGWLDDPDDCAVPAGAELDTSGG